MDDAANRDAHGRPPDLVKPAPFAYVRAATLDEAIARLAGDADAIVLAGGQSLVPMLNMRLVRPSTLVDVNRIPGLEAIVPIDDGVELGALVRHADVAAAPIVRARVPLLATAAAHIGHRAIRNRGTLGGSLAHADPAAELPAAVVALDGCLTVRGPDGERETSAADFFRGLFTTSLAHGEIVTRVRVGAPRATRAGWGFAELARRPGDFALAGVCGVLTADDDGGRVRARLVAFGVGAGPVRLGGAEAALVSAQRLDAASARIAGEAAGMDVEPPDDVHASGEYRRHLVRVLAERVVLDALRRATETDGAAA